MRFRRLGIVEPADSFVRLPSAAAIFQDLRIYQNTAASYLIARGILGRDALMRGFAELQSVNVPLSLQISLRERNSEELPLAKFLVEELSTVPISGSDGLYRKVGLPNRQVAA